MSLYLNQVAALSWWFRTTCSCRESVRWPSATERMSRTGSSSGLLCNWISAKRILCYSYLIPAPFAHLFSLANLPLQMSTLLVVTSNQPSQSASRLGGGWVPLQASRRAALLLSSLSRVVSKYVAAVGGEEERPQIVMTRGEWSEIFLMDGAASILPPLASSSCETRNLSILETADPWPFLLLSKVYSFLTFSWNCPGSKRLTVRTVKLGGARRLPLFCASSFPQPYLWPPPLPCGWSHLQWWHGVLWSWPPQFFSTEWLCL